MSFLLPLLFPHCIIYFVQPISALSFEVADAENLHFEDDSFDLCTIAFGIRNVTHIDKVCYLPFLFSLQ